jgi:hypothetical protein
MTHNRGQYGPPVLMFVVVEHFDVNTLRGLSENKQIKSKDKGLLDELLQGFLVIFCQEVLFGHANTLNK